MHVKHKTSAKSNGETSAWQFVVTEYSKEKKRGVQQVAGTFKVHDLLTSGAIDTFITKVVDKGIKEDEVAAIKDYLLAEYAVKKEASDRRQTENVGQWLDIAIRNIKDANPDHLSQDLTIELYEKMEAIKVALREHGFVKPRAKK